MNWKSQKVIILTLKSNLRPFFCLKLNNLVLEKPKSQHSDLHSTIPTTLGSFKQYNWSPTFRLIHTLRQLQSISGPVRCVTTTITQSYQYSVPALSTYQFLKTLKLFLKNHKNRINFFFFILCWRQWGLNPGHFGDRQWRWPLR